jgi:hypothetical protein
VSSGRCPHDAANMPTLPRSWAGAILPLRGLFGNGLAAWAAGPSTLRALWGHGYQDRGLSVVRGPPTGAAAPAGVTPRRDDEEAPT